jgi:DnaJ family protein C protein 9
LEGILPTASEGSGESGGGGEVQERVSGYALPLNYSTYVSPGLGLRSWNTGSEEERLAVLDAYTVSQGSLDVVFERVMVSSVLDDEERFRVVIQAAIDAGEVKAYRAFTKETAKSKNERRKKAEGEQKEAEEYAKELGVWDALFGNKKKAQEGEQKVHSGEAEVDGDENEDRGSSTKPKASGRVKGKEKAATKPKEDSKPKSKKAKNEDDTSALEALIKSRQQNREANFLSNLEAKYGAGGSEVTKGKTQKKTQGRGRGKKAVDEKAGEETAEPTEQEFRAAREKIEKNTAKKRGVGKVENTGEARETRRSKRVKTG